MSDENKLDIIEFMQKAVSDSIEQARNPKKETDVLWEGTHVKLPAEPKPMSLRSGIQVLLDREAQDNQQFDLFETVPGMPLDAAVAFVHVLKKRYGWAAAKTKKTWFGDVQPDMKMVKTGPNSEDYVEVPVGLFKLHDISTEIETGFTRPQNRRKSQFMDFYIRGTVTYADRKVIMELISATRKHLEKNSIYRGKTMRLSVDESGSLDALIEPEFIDLTTIDENSLVLNENIQGLVDVNIKTPIAKTENCRKHNIPLKRGILLYGPYGTGKSLTAAVVGKLAYQNGWTYVTVDRAEALAETLEFARQFQPCVVFAEDIDRVIDHKRSDDANEIINTIDSVLNKRDEVITVLTTNHIEKLPPVMLRNGRLDALIPIDKPDAVASIKLVRYYAGDLIRPDDPLTGLGDMLAGFIPATIREVVERSKLAMLMNDRKHLTTDDLKASATGLKAHADLLVDKRKEINDAELLAATLKRVINPQAADYGDKFADMSEYVTNVDGNVDEAQRKLDVIIKMVKTTADSLNGKAARR
jgi:transitional endoplasmic reticulum ATPase